MQNRVRSVITTAAVLLAMTAGIATAQDVPVEASVPHEGATLLQAAVQGTAEAVQPDAAVEAASGPRVSASAITVRAEQRENQEAVTAMVQRRDRRGTTLMMVGGAAFLAGLLIGDDAGAAVAVGGALVGLYGLYLYMQ